MGDSLMPTHRLHFRFFGGMATVPVMYGTHRSQIALVQVADQQSRETDGIHSWTNGAQADLLTDEVLADKTSAASPPNLSIAANPPHRIVGAIFQVGQTLWKLPPALAIPL